MADRLHALEQLQAEKVAQLEASKAELDSLQQTNVLEIYEEAKAVFPLLTEIGIAQDFTKTDFKTPQELTVVLIKWATNKSSTGMKRDEPKLMEFIKRRLKLENVQLVSY